MRDWVARSFTKFFRFFADTFFANRYGHRAIVLETVAGVPRYVDSFEKSKTNEDRIRPMIRELLEEAENERMHLMFFVELIKPNLLERLLVLLAQGIFWVFYFTMYVLSPKTAHRMIYYFEKEAVRSYTDYLSQISKGNIEDVPAPKLAIDYYSLNKDAKLSDMIKCIRDDERKHSKVNLGYSK